jgi:hypothetical protein
VYWPTNRRIVVRAGSTTLPAGGSWASTLPSSAGFVVGRSTVWIFALGKPELVNTAVAVSAL